ncbi:MAG: hypothetical protein PHI31_09800 [Desulfuromonadaceae bacterium]|nr:hypothetical protein [Desulfuromonadaceae bacterium]
MRKVNLTTLETFNEPLPSSLRGLLPESLVDLSWSPPELGLTEFGWWPIIIVDYHNPDLEQITGWTDQANPEDKTVTVTAIIDPLPAETIAQIVADAKTVKSRECDLLAKSKREQLTATIAPGEMASWPIKRAEALAYQSTGQATDAPNLVVEADAREIPLEVLVDKVMAKAAQLSYIEAHLAGINGKHNDAIALLTTAAAVRDYDITTGWPM